MEFRGGLSKKINRLMERSNTAISLFSKMIDDLSKMNKELDELRIQSQAKANEYISLSIVADHKIKENNSVIDKISKIIN